MGKQNKGLNKQRFRGQFKISNTDYELSGDLFFDLSDGIKLISMVTDGHMRATPDGGLSITRYFEENQISVIHGILEDSRDCTLLGHISCTSTNYYGNGLVNIEICANHIVFGKHLEDSILYNTVNFSITGLDEFYGITKHTPCSYPQTIDSVRHLINLDDSHQVENLNLDDIMFVSNSALKEVIDIEVKKELSNREKNIVFKSNKKKIIHLEYKNPVTLDQVTSDTLLLSNLIAFLINSPTLPFDVSVFDEGSTKPLNILTSRIRNEDTLNMIRGENEHVINVNANTVNFPQVAMNWIDGNYDFTVLSALVQHRGNWINRRDIHGDLLILCSHLENINFELKGDDRTKYLKPIEVYGSEFVVRKLDTFFQNKFCKDIGKCISEIRNDIAHPQGHNNGFLIKIYDYELRDLALILLSIIISKIFDETGIEPEVIDDYQYHLCKFLLK